MIVIVFGNNDFPLPLLFSFNLLAFFHHGLSDSEDRNPLFQWSQDKSAFSNVSHKRGFGLPKTEGVQTAKSITIALSSYICVHSSPRRIDIEFTIRAFLAAKF